MLKIDAISVAYGDRCVVDHFSLQLKQGEIGCLLGPSGCSKTTVLRTVAGFLPLQSGSLSINGREVSNPQRCYPPEQRDVGMVFQDFALFPHLTVAQNVAFGIGRWKPSEKDQRVKVLLKLIGLEEMGNRFPHELSGGQQQRVALIRALAPKPKLLLMDEPFSNIDVEFREKLTVEVAQLLRQEGVTALLVTHDQNEAFLMADAIGVMRAGQLEQWDSGYNLYHKPKTRFVADFVGQGVFLNGTVLEDGRVATELAVMEGVLPENTSVGDAVRVLVRPDDIVHDDCSPRKAVIKNRVFRGASYLYTLELPNGESLLSMVHSHHDHAVGEALGITLEIAHSVIFPADA